GRGPGETKLEVDRRRVKERIASLERQLRALEKGRRERRKARRKRGVPVVSIIGYTNAGKSTLLNALTGARVLAENRLFATLDPTNRTVVLPGGTPCILSDTVGFIRRMPADLKVAFRATLEELQDATLLLHVVDATSPYVEEEIEAVEEILHELELEHKPRMVVYNKVDLLDGDPPNGLAVSAKRGENLDLLLQEVEERIKGSFEESQIQMELG
ncbi:MAG: GTPase HflX, partial [Aquificota bacterium]